MPYCTKCGAEVDEDMAFCPKCGAPLKGERPAPEAKPPKSHRKEKEEKREKIEKREKSEKHEKRQAGITGPLVGGLILIVLGLTFYLKVSGLLKGEATWALFFILVGAIIVFGALYAARTAAKRHPEP